MRIERFVFATMGIIGAVCAIALLELFFLADSPFSQGNIDRFVGGLLGLCVSVYSCVVCEAIWRRIFIGIGAFVSISFVLEFDNYLFALGYLAGIGVSLITSQMTNTRRRRSFFVGLVAAGLVLLSICLFVARKDYLSRPEKPPEALAWLLRNTDARIRSFRQYSAGGFFDRQFLWRIEAQLQVIDLVLTKLPLVQITSDRIPDEAFDQSAYWWPRSARQGYKYFISPEFPTEARTNDGRHYFVIVEEGGEIAFMWVIDIF